MLRAYSKYFLIIDFPIIGQRRFRNLSLRSFMACLGQIAIGSVGSASMKQNDPACYKALSIRRATKFPAENPIRIPFICRNERLNLLMKNVCKSHQCVSCCYETEMLLLDEDVTRIVGLGFKEDYFVELPDGFKVLKNSKEGRCVFHDGKQCTIYENRPAGCKLYPVIFDENLGAPVKDGLCPFREEFLLTPRNKNELTTVYLKLIEERELAIAKSDERREL